MYSVIKTQNPCNLRYSRLGQTSGSVCTSRIVTKAKKQFLSPHKKNCSPGISNAKIHRTSPSSTFCIPSGPGVGWLFLKAPTAYTPSNLILYVEPETIET